MCANQIQPYHSTTYGTHRHPSSAETKDSLLWLAGLLGLHHLEQRSQLWLDLAKRWANIRIELPALPQHLLKLFRPFLLDLRAVARAEKLEVVELRVLSKIAVSDPR